MDRRRFAIFAAMLTVLMGIVVLTQITITPAPAQMGPTKITGKVTDKIIKSFDASGLPGIHSIQYRRFVMSPGARVENLVVDDHAELCTARKGTITVTTPDGSKHTFKGGDIFNVPLNAQFKLITVDAKVGFDELYWSVNVKERKE